MKNIQTIMLSFCVLIIVSCSNGNSSFAQQNVDAKTFNTEIKKTPGTILDVRTAEEFQQGHLKDAINMDFYDDNFEKNVSSLNKEKPVYVYCAKGGRSSKAADKMKKAGFKKIYNLECGYNCWSEAGLPVVK